MKQLFETIKVLDGKLFNIEYHNNRMNAARKELFSADKIICLENAIVIPLEFAKGLYKCKVIFGKEIESVNIIPYKPKKIEKLVLVYDDKIEYNYKYLDRTPLDELKNKFAPKENEEIIIVKNGLVTDCSYANIIFREVENYYTPSTPLLNGTMRQKLLDEKKIIEREIRVSDIENYSEIHLINAMIEISDRINVVV
ncbi:MAG: aminotransferase class IV [Melioribacteraceae bacterium]|nr:aminotransferase class IV [Melioribacteraceae bacterium]